MAYKRRLDLRSVTQLRDEMSALRRECRELEKKRRSLDRQADAILKRVDVVQGKIRALMHRETEILDEIAVRRAK